MRNYWSESSSSQERREHTKDLIQMGPVRETNPESLTRLQRRLEGQGLQGDQLMVYS
jgi:hypothetical protein